MVPKDEKCRRQKPEDMKKAVEAARNVGVGLACHTHCSKSCPRKTFGRFVVENSTVTVRVGNTPARIEEEVVSLVFTTGTIRVWYNHRCERLTFPVAELSNVSHVFSTDKERAGKTVGILRGHEATPTMGSETATSYIHFQGNRFK
jgi:hypothetical protein